MYQKTHPLVLQTGSEDQLLVEFVEMLSEGRGAYLHRVYRLPS